MKISRKNFGVLNAVSVFAGFAKGIAVLGLRNGVLQKAGAPKREP